MWDLTGLFNIKIIMLLLLGCFFVGFVVFCVICFRDVFWIIRGSYNDICEALTMDPATLKEVEKERSGREKKLQ